MKRCALLRGGPLDGQLLDVESTAETITFPVRIFGHPPKQLIYRYRGMLPSGMPEFQIDHDPMRHLQFGRYSCKCCGTEYTVIDDTWRRCTPYLCHACLERADAAMAFVKTLIP